jgi:hypothetical protein
MTRSLRAVRDRLPVPRVDENMNGWILAALAAIGGACGTSASRAPAAGSMTASGSASGSSAAADAPPAPAPAPASGSASAWVSPAAAAACAAGANATIDADLRAEVGQGTALPDHVGPAAAARIDAELARDPATTLDRYTCLFLDAAPEPADASGFLALPLWRLRAAAPDRVRQLARRVVDRYDALVYRAPDPADPGFAERLADRRRAMTVLAGGLDVAAGPRWKALEAGAVTACVTSTPDGGAVIAVTQECSCGQTIACAATPGAGGLALDVRFDPDSPAECTDCYPTTTACTLPRLAASAKVAVTVGGKALATWPTDARGAPTSAACK